MIFKYEFRMLGSVISRSYSSGWEIGELSQCCGLIYSIVMLPYLNLNLVCILSQERERPIYPISIILTFIHI